MTRTVGVMLIVCHVTYMQPCGCGQKLVDQSPSNVSLPVQHRIDIVTIVTQIVNNTTIKYYSTTQITNGSNFIEINFQEILNPTKYDLYLVSRQRRDGMFTLNIMRKTRYDEVTAYCWTGFTDEFRGNILIWNTSQLRILSQNSSVGGPCPTVGGHFVIARFSHYI